MQASDQRAKVFEDGLLRGAWRVEKMSPDGGYDDVQVFIGPDACEKAIRYASRTYGGFELIQTPA